MTGVSGNEEKDVANITGGDAVVPVVCIISWDIRTAEALRTSCQTTSKFCSSIRKLQI